MFAPDVRFEGFTATDWVRVLSLFRPRRASGEAREPDRPRGGIVAVHGGGRLWKLVHSDAGRLRLDDAQNEWPLSAEALAGRHRASWALILEAGALETIMDRFGARARRDDDLVAQLVTIAQLVREEMTAGRIELWPTRLRGIPVPSPGMVRGSIDTVCPVDRAMLLGLFEAGELWTSIALFRSEAGFNLILGPDEIRGDMGLLSGDWRRDYRHLARAIEERAGALAFGCYAEVSTIRNLAVDATPGAWARATAVRDIILAPLPAPLAIPLGVDAGRAAFTALRGLAERIDPIGIVTPSLQALRRATIGDRDVVAMLGFHPLELLRKLLSRER